MRGDLRIRHLHHKLIPILHGDRQALFTGERLHADQRPVSGIHRLRVDLCDLFLC